MHIFISGKPQAMALRKAINGNDTVIACDCEASRALAGVKHTMLNDHTRFSNDLAFKWMKELGRRKFEGGSLITSFELDGTSLWWWMEYWLYASSAYYDSFYDVFRIFTSLYRLLLKEKPNKVVFVDDGSLTARSLQILCIELKIEAEQVPGRNPKPNMLVRELLIKSFFEMRFHARKLAWRILVASKQQTRNKSVLVVCESNPRDSAYTDPIISALKGRATAVDVSIGDVFLNLELFQRKGKDAGARHLLLENYLTDMKTVNSVHKSLVAEWQRLRHRQEFHSIFSINGISCWKLFEPQLNAYFRVRLRNHLQNFYAVQSLVNNEKPIGVITPAETSEFDKGLFVACHRQGIPVVSVQHGNIHDLRCVHQKAEVSLTEVKPRYCPLPSITAVYGESDKGWLIDAGNYPEGGVVITGNQRDDALYSKLKSFNRPAICKELGLDAKNKTIVLATQTFNDPKDREVLAQAVSEAVGKMSGVQLVLKVHPGEEIEYYQKIVHNALVTKADVYKVLFAADCLITSFSAIGLEAAIIGKPILMLNLTAEPDMVDYAKEGIALYAKSEEEIKPLLEKLLYDEAVLQQLAKARESYVLGHSFRVDGKAAERIVSELDKLLAAKK